MCAYPIRRAAVLIVVLAVSPVACGSGPDEPVVLDYRTVAGAPTPGTLTIQQSRSLSGPVERLGRTAEGDLVAVFDSRVHETAGDSLELRRRYVDEGASRSYGGVHDIEPRGTGGAYLATDEGLFLLGSLFVTRSPISDEVGRVRAISEAESGALAGLWLASERGLFLNTPAGLQELTIAHQEETPRRVAVERWGRVAAVVYRDVLLTLHPNEGYGTDGDSIVARRPDLPTGTIHDVAAIREQIWVAADHGLFAYDPSLLPAWTQFTLSDEEPVPVLGLAVDAETADVWARTHDALVHVAKGQVTAYRQPPWESGEPTLALDRLGRLWSGGAGDTLQTAAPSATGSGSTTFAAEMAPWIEQHCARCHSNQTADFKDYEVFKARAHDALSRVQSGDMPRCDGGLRCPPEDNLMPADYAVLAQWIRDGLLP